MPDIEEERRHLADAERHIAEARQRLRETRAHLDAPAHPAVDVARLQELHDTMRDTLVAMEEHRDIIEHTIKNLESHRR